MVDGGCMVAGGMHGCWGACQQLKFTLNLLYGFRNDTSKLLVSTGSTLRQFAG